VLLTNARACTPECGKVYRDRLRRDRDGRGTKCNPRQPRGWTRAWCGCSAQEAEAKPEGRPVASRPEDRDLLAELRVPFEVGPDLGARVEGVAAEETAAVTVPLTRELVDAMREAAEQEEQAAIEAALFTARTEEERRWVLEVLRERARNQAARTYS